MTNTSNLDLERPDRGAEDWDTSINSNMTKLDTGYGNNVASIADLPEVYIETGTFNSTTGDVITLPKAVDAISEYSVSITPTTGVGGDIGFIYVTKTTSNFTVHCSVGNTTDTFAAVIYYIGDVASYGGSIYRRWYVSTDAAITDHSDDTDVGSYAWVLAQIGATLATVELPGNKTYTCTANPVSTPATIKLIPQMGAIFDGAATLTFANPGQIDALPNQNLFGATVTIVFTAPGTVYPEWWYVSGTYAAAVIKANISAGGTLDFTGTTYDLEGIAALDATITEDVRWISSNGQATLTNALTEKLEFPTGINVHYDNLKFDTWWSPLDTYFTYDTLVIKNCYFNNVKRACRAWAASVYATSDIGSVEITNNTVVNSENGFIVKSLVGNARVTENYIEGIESSSYTYGIAIGDHDNATGTVQANTKNIVIANNVIKDINSTAVGGTTSNAISVCGTNITISNNVIENIDCVSTDDAEAIYTKAIGLTVTGNTILDVDGTSAAIIIKGEAAAPKGELTIVRNNTLVQSANSCDQGIGFIGGALKKAVISGNVMDGFNDNGIKLSGDLEDIAIKDNLILNTGGEAGIVLWTGDFDNINISNNDISGVVGKAAAFANGIKVRAEAGHINDLTISNNKIKIDALVANTTGTYGVYIQPSDASADIEIKNNNFQITHDTSAPYGIEVSDDVAIDDISITGNQFNDIENTERAITFSFINDLYTSTDYIANITNVHIAENYAGARLVEPIPMIAERTKRSMRIVYDFTESGGAVGNHTIDISDIIPPTEVIITRAWYVVTTQLASGTSAATFGLSFPAAADYNIMALAIITGSGTTGIHDTIVNGDLANFLQAASPSDLSINVGVEEITAGVVSLFLDYVEYR